MSTQCETCSGKGYIHTTRTPGEKEYVERCDECHQEGRVSWTDEQAAEYARRATHRGEDYGIKYP